MKHRITAIALGFAVLSCTPCFAQGRRPPGETGEWASFGWFSSLQRGKAEARKSGRPMMVVIRCVP